MTNPPFPEEPNPESSTPGTPPPAPPAGPPMATPTPAWNTAPDGVPGADADSPATDFPATAHPVSPAAEYPAPPAAGDPAPGAPVYTTSTPASPPPGRVLAIVGLVLAFVVAPVGLIISIVAAVKLGKTGQPKGLAIAGIIVGAIVTIFWAILLVVMFTVFAALFGMCAELGPGVWEVDGVTYRCG